MAFVSLTTIHNIHLKPHIYVAPQLYTYNGTNLLSTMGSYTVLKLTTSGTLTLNLNKTINYFIVGGGGGGGMGRSNSSGNSWGGNAGNGGVLLQGSFSHNGNLTYTVVVGIGGASSTNGGVSSIVGNSQNISCAGGLAGAGNFMVRTYNTSVTNSNLGGAGGNDSTTSNVAGAGLNGITFVPNNIKYGCSGSGGVRVGTTPTPFTGAGKGGVNSASGTNATLYGCSGGGGGGTGGTGAGGGGTGFYGVVFLYWT